MKAVTGVLPTVGSWAFELKWDGMRVVAAVGDSDRQLRLDTTRGLDAAARFPELAGLPEALAPHRLVLDGEVVAFRDGRPSFGQLQHRMHLSRPAEIVRVAPTIPVVYVVFDLLWLDGEDLTARPYLERRERLFEVVEPGESWLVPAHHVGGGADLLAAAQEQRLEGIVAKRTDSRYLPGKRNPAWIKVKVRPPRSWWSGAGSRARAAGPVIWVRCWLATTRATPCASPARSAPGSAPTSSTAWAASSEGWPATSARSTRRLPVRSPAWPGGCVPSWSQRSPSPSGPAAAPSTTPATSRPATTRTLTTWFWRADRRQSAMPPLWVRPSSGWTVKD